MLNERIRQLRIARGINQVDLAKALSVTKQTVSNWENDNIQPSIEMLVKIAAFFNVTTDYMLGLDNERVINVSDLSAQQVAHIALLIEDLRNK